MSELRLQIEERIQLEGQHYARFNGQHVMVETHTGLGRYVVRLKLSPVMMQQLIAFNERVASRFPEKWAIDPPAKNDGD